MTLSCTPETLETAAIRRSWSMRLKSDIWVKAFIRRCETEGASAYVVRHGDGDAGAIYVKASRLDGTAVVFGPVPGDPGGGDNERRWARCHRQPLLSEGECDAYLARQLEFDADLWIVEVEDRGGRSFLDDWLAKESQ